MYGQSVGSAKWNLLGSKTGTATQSLPSDFNEVLVDVCLPSETDTLNYMINIPKGMLSSSYKGFRSGNYISASNHSGILLNASLTSVALSYAQKAGTEVTSTSTITVYYR